MARAPRKTAATVANPPVDPTKNEDQVPATAGIADVSPQNNDSEMMKSKGADQAVEGIASIILADGGPETAEPENMPDLRARLVAIDQRINSLRLEIVALEEKRQEEVEGDYARRQLASSSVNHSGRAQAISRILREDPATMKAAESRQFAQLKQELAQARRQKTAGDGSK